MKKSDELYVSEHTKLECILNNLKKSLNINKTDEVQNVETKFSYQMKFGVLPRVFKAK